MTGESQRRRRVASCESYACRYRSSGLEVNLQVGTKKGGKGGDLNSGTEFRGPNKF